ncbi:unnamed protein product [Bubo scandiacus]
MYAKGKGSGVPSDGQAREKLALYVYEYLLHVGAQKSAQTFLSEIRWEKNITLGEPPGFLHSWWCVFWDLYCAAPDRRETCEHSSEAKAFHDYSAAAAPSPVMGNLPPGDGIPGGAHAPRLLPALHVPPATPAAPGPRSGCRTSLPWVSPAPSRCCPTPWIRPRGHRGIPAWGARCSALNPPRGMAGMAPQTYGSGMRPPPSSLAGPGIPTMNMGPGGRGPWPNPNANSIAYSSSSPGNYVFPMGPGPEGPMGGMSAMEPHHMNGSLGSGDMDGLPKSSPSNLGALSNPPRPPPRDDAELSSNFLNPFQSDSYSPSMTMSV